MEHYNDIIRAREIIKRKFNALRHGETEASLALEKHFKPLAEPLKAILRIKDLGVDPVMKEEPSFEKKEEIMEEKEEPAEDTSVNSYVKSKFGPLAGPYFQQMIRAGGTGRGNKKFDHVFGIRHGGGTVAEWMMGSKTRFVR